MTDDLSFSQKCLAYLRRVWRMPVGLYETWLVMWQVNKKVQDERPPTEAPASEPASDPKQTADANNIINVNWWKGSLHVAREPAGPRRSSSIRCVAIIAVISIAALGLLATTYLNASAGITYETGAHESRTARLADGTHVALKERAKVSVNFTAERRLIRLIAGEVIFTAAHDAKRPLVIKTAWAELALADSVPGGTFGILVNASMTVVTAYGKAVRLFVRHDAGQKTPLKVTVHPGKPYRIPPKNSRVGALLGWRRSTGSSLG